VTVQTQALLQDAIPKTIAPIANTQSNFFIVMIFKLNIQKAKIQKKSKKQQFFEFKIRIIN
jgi:hypothetical protein